MKFLKTSIILYCGLFLVFQLLGCRQDEHKNDSASEKDQPHKPGPGEGGGGDPDAQRFIFLSHKLTRFYQENPANLDLPFSAEDFFAIVKRLDESIKDPAVTDALEFTQIQLTDENGVSKVALFDRTLGSIKVNRDYWSTSTDEDKLVLINMEIAGLLGIDLRYERALALVKDRAALILAMAIADTGEKTPIGWWLAHQDPNIFARISENDVVIDGGVIGTGSVSNQRVVQFLKNPSSDEEWYSLSQRAFRQGLPAYLVLRDFTGSRASLTAFRQTPSAFPTYTLLFAAQSKPVGVCDHNSTELSALERIKNCLFDTRFYSTSDTESSFAELAERLQAHFAYSTETMALALQELLIQDYRGLFTPQFRRYVLKKSADGHGLTPTLTKGEVSFWEIGTQSDPQSVRFYKAMERMAQDRVGFYPGQQPACLYELQGVTHDTEAEKEKPRIVSLNELHVMTEEDRCLLRNGDFIDAKFYFALAQQGYEYDYLKTEWRKGSPRTVSDSLMLSQFKTTNELETRIVTENLSADLSYQLISDAIQRSDLAIRLTIYDILFRWKQLGLRAEQAIQLFRIALQDISHMDSDQNRAADLKNLEWAVNDVFPLIEFVETSFGLAVSNKLITPALSKEYLTGIMQAPWFSSQIARNLLFFDFSSANQDPTFSNFSFIMTTLIEKSFFDVLLAQNIYSQLKNEVKVSYSIRYTLLKKLLKTGLDFTEDKEDLQRTIDSLKIGAQFEKQTEMQNASLKDQVTLLCETFKTANDASILNAFVKKFFAEHDLPDSLQNQLFAAYMALIRRSLDPSESLRALSEISYEVSMTKEQREKLYRFIFLNFPYDKTKSARAHFSYTMMYTSRHSMDIRQSLQLLLELMMQTSEQKIGETGLLPELEAQDHTEARDVVRDLERCRSEDPSTICPHIHSPHKILSLIVMNPNLSEQTRQAAQTELHLRH